MAWFWFALSSAILWGLSYAISSLTLKYFSPAEILFCESIVIFVILFPYLWHRHFFSFIGKLAEPKLLLLLLLSALISGFANLLILKSITTSEDLALISVIEASYPIFTMIFAFILFRTFQVNLLSGLGFIMIISGVVLVKIYGN